MENRTIKIKKFYTCQERMELLFDRYGRQDGMKAETKEEYESWKKSIIPLLKSLLALNRMENCSLDPIVEERVEAEPGIIREKVIIQVEPQVYMPVFILIPEKKEREGRQKCALAPCGHMGAGKYSVAGLSEIGAVADQINRFHYDYGLQLARKGIVALCPDTRGFGERREPALQGEDEDSFCGSSCNQLAHMAEPLGLTVAGMYTWDLMRLLDYVEERDQWDLDDIGCVGISGGGLQTLWLAALDSRVSWAVISGYFYGYKDSLLKLNGNCGCNYVPHLWEHVDMGDIGALIAPRPLVIQSCRGDHLNGIRGLENVLEQLDTVKKAYRIFNAEDKLYHDIQEGGHCWHESAIEAVMKVHKDLC